MGKSKEVFWQRPDVFGNHISFYEETWHIHASKHMWDKPPASQEHFYQTIVDPDHAHRSLDPVIGDESCVFAKFFEAEQQIFIVPVLYENVISAGDYDQGGKSGKVLTGYFPSRQNLSRTIGEIFWSKSVGSEKKAPK